MKKGFTVIELMVGLVVFGIIIAASIPAFSKFMQSWRLGGDLDRFAGIMQRARSASVTKNTTTIFKFKMSDGTFFYFEDDNESGTRDADEYQSAIHQLSAGITIKEHTLGGPILIFESRGNANESGDVTLENSREQTRKLSIFGGTGNIKTD